ncbi:MAG: hypothetical protein KAR56_00495 [Thermoplasmata archaeon]|nr:hypothetical protein [Thermoplasmata archaeon]
MSSALTYFIPSGGSHNLYEEKSETKAPMYEAWAEFIDSAIDNNANDNSEFNVWNPVLINHRATNIEQNRWEYYSDRASTGNIGDDFEHTQFCSILLYSIEKYLSLCFI